MELILYILGYTYAILLNLTGRYSKIWRKAMLHWKATPIKGSELLKVVKLKFSLEQLTYMIHKIKYK